MVSQKKYITIYLYDNFFMLFAIKNILEIARREAASFLYIPKYFWETLSSYRWKETEIYI